MISFIIVSTFTNVERCLLIFSCIVTSIDVNWSATFWKPFIQICIHHSSYAMVSKFFTRIIVHFHKIFNIEGLKMAINITCPLLYSFSQIIV